MTPLTSRKSFQDLAWLYAAFAANMLLPLIMLPIVGRALGADGWGRAAFAQAFAQYLALLIDYGFAFSATRAVAQSRADASRLADLLAAVTGAKLLFIAAAFTISLIVGLCLPAFRNDPACWAAGTLLGITQGASLSWFFQGIERLRLVAVLDCGTKLVATIAIIICITTPADAWMVPGFLAMAQILSLGISAVIAWRTVAWRRPTRSSIAAVLRDGLALFGFRCATSLYSVGNAFILGLFAPAAVVGYYAAAERLAGALRSGLGPINQLLFPRMSHLAATDRREATRIARIGLVGLVGVGLIGSAVLALCAPLAIDLLAGPDFAPAVPVLRLLCLSVPLVAASNLLGTQWMLPLGMDRPFLVIILAGGFTNLALVALLVTGHGATGMAWAVIGAETVVTLGMLTYLLLTRRDPFRPAPIPAGNAA